MAYNPTTWKDQIVTDPTKYKIIKENGAEELVNIEKVPEEIIQEGTRITADKLNNIEEGIKGTADLVNDLAGEGRTEETVKKNADDIGSLSTQMAELETDINSHLADIATEATAGHIKLSDLPPTKGLRVLPIDPSTPEEGEMWLNSTEKVVKTIVGGIIHVTNLASEVYLLREGDEKVPFEQGFFANNGTLFTRNPDGLYLEVNTRWTPTSVASFSTSNLINLSNVVSILFLCDIEGGTGYSSRGTTYFVVGTEKDATFNCGVVFSISDNSSGINNNKQIQLNVGGVSGDYYIRVHVVATGAGTTTQFFTKTTVRSIWLIHG